MARNGYAVAGVKRLATSFWLAFAAVVLPGCQFPNYNVPAVDAQGGASNAGASGNASVAGVSGGGGSGGSSQPPLCEDGQECVPAAPGGWLGPIAYWQGKSGSELPDCPDGYADETDLHAEPSGAPAACSCSCAAMDQTCEDVAQVELFGDLGCQSTCETATTDGCTAIDGCTGNSVSIDVAEREPSGRCEVSMTKQVGSISWQRDARLCALTDVPEACGSEHQCTPTPSAPFASQLCVYRVVRAGQAAPPCPDSYPNGPDELYTAFEDERECGECECSGPDGGTCGGQVNVSANACDAGTAYQIGSGCKQLILNAPPKNVEVHYTMTPGTCGIASEPEPIGAVVPSGNYHAVCCL